MEENDFIVDDNENLVEYKQAVNIMVGDYLLISNYPCRVVDRQTSKTGKHGGCKINFVGIDIFTEKKYATIYKTGDTVSVPIVKKRDYQVMSINDESPAFMSLMASDDSSLVREDIQLPDNEMGKKIWDDYNSGKDLVVTIQKAMKQEMVIQYRIDKSI